MITGSVNPFREPIIRVSLLNANGQMQERPALVDTGYTGWLTLPPAEISVLGLRWKRLGGGVLADGSQVTFDVYEATVLWDGQTVTISVDEADAESLVGMSMMYGYELTLSIVDGGTLVLRKL